MKMVKKGFKGCKSSVMLTCGTQTSHHTSCLNCPMNDDLQCHFHVGKRHMIINAVKAKSKDHVNKWWYQKQMVWATYSLHVAKSRKERNLVRLGKCTKGDAMSGDNNW